MSQFKKNELDKVYESIKNERGEIASIYKEFNAFPKGIAAHFKFYKDIMLSDNLPLPRSEREFLAFLSSESNSCLYCVSHHGEASKNYPISISKEKEEFYRGFSHTLTKEPWKGSQFKERGKKIGLSEAQYAHATMIVSYFNMANRMVFALDVSLEENFEDSCT